MTAPIVRFGPTRTVDTPSVNAIAAAPKGSLVAIMFGDASVRIYDAANGRKIKVFRGHPQQGYAIAWSHNGKFLATGDESARIFVWNLATGQKIAQFRTHARGIEELSFSKDDNLILSTGKDDVLKIYDIKANKERITIASNGAGHYGAEWIPNTNDIGVATLMEGERFYDEKGDILHTFNLNTGQGALDEDFDPTGRMFVTGGKDGKTVIWNAKTDTRVGTLRGHDDMVLHVAVAPSGTVCATSSDDRTVRLWDMKKFAQVGILPNQSAVGSPVRFTADGKFLVSADIDDRLEFTPVIPAQPMAPVKPVKPVKRVKVRRTRHHGRTR
jgi:WD40 repeat protein